MNSRAMGRERLLDVCFALLRATAFAASDLERRARGRLGPPVAWLALGAWVAGLAAARFLAHN